MSKPLVDIIIPVYNEELALEACILKLRKYLLDDFPYSWKITIADNASTDKTQSIGTELQERYDGKVKYVRIPQKGRGRALRQTWLESNADILAYMDVDLSTDLKSFLPMIEPLTFTENKMHLATGCRLSNNSEITRSAFREFVSRVYNLMVKMIFPKRKFIDAQCGFKAISQQVAQKLLPLVKNDNWFFDSELLLLAEHYGFTIHEVPVEWIEDPKTTVNIPKTAYEDIKGLLRVRFMHKPRWEELPAAKDKSVVKPGSVFSPSIKEGV